MNEIMQHVLTMQQRVEAWMELWMSKLTPSGPPKVKPLARSHEKPADAKDEREAMTIDSSERTDRAQAIRRDSGPKPLKGT